MAVHHRHSPHEFVCECIEDARPSVDTRGRPEYTRIFGTSAGEDNDMWDHARLDIVPLTLTVEHDRLRMIIQTLDLWIKSMETMHRATASYTNMDRARESLRRLRAHERLMSDVKWDGPWSPNGTAECLRLAQRYPALFWPKFWEWVGYAELDDPVFQTQVQEPEMNAFLVALGPGLVAIMAADPEHMQSQICRAALTNALKRRVIWEEHIGTSYFLAAMHITGLAGNYVPPRLPHSSRYYGNNNGHDGRVDWWAR
jgi:hypothetical protein